MATVRELESGNQQVLYRLPNGKQTSKTFKINNYYYTKKNKDGKDIRNSDNQAKKEAIKAAEKFVSDIEAKLTLGIAKEEKNITFGKFAKNFMEIHIEDLKGTTIHNYLMYVRLLNKEFEHMKIVDMTPIMLDKYFLKLLKQRKLKMNTIKKYRDILKLVLNDAYKKDIIPVNPLDKLAFKFTYEDENKDQFVSYRDFKRILESFEMEYYRHFMLLGYYTGMRKGEMLALTWDNIDFENRLIYVNKNLVLKYENNKVVGQEITTPKTKKSKRPFYIHDKLYELLHEIKYTQEHNKMLLLDEYNDNDLIICKDDGSYLNTMTVSKTFTEKQKIYGVNLTPHKLRHTFATLANEINDLDLVPLLGHRHKKMTEHYQHHQKFSEDTKEKLNSIFSVDGMLMESKRN